MLPRRATRVLAVSILSLTPLSFTATALGQAGPVDPAAEIDNARFATIGQVNANSVFVRSGPSENDYPVLRMDRGDKLTVVGMRFEWLKVKPPEGAFCYVAKAFVDRRGDGSVGRVNNTLYVRVGSRLNDMRTKVAMKLEPGADVKILDEKDEYFMIAPPEGVYLYVSKRFVDPLGPADQPPAVATNDQSVVPAVPDTGTTSTPAAPPSDTSTPPAIADAGTTTNPPTTAPAIATTEQLQAFTALEARYKAADGQPIEQQPIDELLSGYEAIASDDSQAESIRALAEFRVKALKIRQEARAQYAEVQRMQAEAAERQRASIAERQELEERLKQTAVTNYAAVGTLRPSSLQMGGQTLYRLTDPSTGRTVIYIRSNEPALASLMGQFVGVRGAVTDDARMRLKYVTPSVVESVDPTLVNQSIVATHLPPSMQPTGTAQVSPD